MACLPRTFIAAAFSLPLLCSIALRAQRSPPNAADLYSKAYAELQKELRLGTAEAADYPLVEAPDPAAFRRAPWPALLAKTAVARSLFEQAAASERCVLPTKPGALVDTVVQMGTMQRFVVAHAYSEMKVLPDQTVADTVALLGHARHLSSQRRLLYSALALNFATKTLALCEATLRANTNPPLPARALRRLRRAVDRYKERCADLAALADQQRERAREDLDAALAAAELGPETATEAKRRTLELVADFYGLLRNARGSKPQDLAQLEAAFAAKLKKQSGGERLLRLLDGDKAEALASALASLVCSSSVELFTTWSEHAAQLDRVEALLKARMKTGAADEQPAGAKQSSGG